MSLFLGILVGTGLLWLLNILVVNPITKYFTLKKLNGYPTMPEEGAQNLINKNFSETYIVVDILVLGIAGFAMGFFIGWFFIGITWKKIAIPGMLTFIGLSILGYLLNKGYI